MTEKEKEYLRYLTAGAGRIKTLPTKPKRSDYMKRLKGQRSPAAPGLEPKIREAEKALRTDFPARAAGSREELLEAEARASSAIENEFGEERVRSHIETLKWLWPKTLDEKTLLEAHRRLMEGQPRAQPGMYRTVNVRVGEHIAPPHDKVAAQMEKFMRYIRRTPDAAPAAAAWGHAQFETIHPFADGNGRSGRAIIQKQLKSPLPMSIWILENRPAYYSMLGCGDWELYLEWFLEGIIAACRETADEGWRERAEQGIERAKAKAPLETYSL